MSRTEDGPSAVTIKDVAALAGVALSSVSRVLSGHPDVSAKMKERVEAAAAELNYEPHLLAQSLRRGSTRTIGFVLRDISNPMFAQIARRCEQELRAAGYSMILTNSDGDVDAEPANLALMRRRRVDGVIVSLVSETSDNTRAALAGLNVPVVLLDREVQGAAYAAVLCDHFTGVKRATEELLMRGHRRIALITGEVDVRSSRERIRGYRAAFEEAGVPVDEEMLHAGGFDTEYAQAKVMRMLSSSRKPTAILTGGVATTAGAMRALRQLRRDPQSEVALVALDEWPMFDVFAPDLASVARDYDEMGTAAAWLMLDMLGGSEAREIVIDTVFTPRASITAAAEATTRKG
jgi:LacI family transcriptional regulator